MSRDRLFTVPFVFAAAANMFQGLSFSLFIHFPGYLQDLGAHEVQIGLIVGVASIASIAVRPAVGKAMDTKGRRPVILTGNVLNIGALCLYLTVTSLGPWIYVVRVLHGIAVALLFTSLFTYGADVIPASRRTEGLALFGVSGLLPIALGGLIGDLVLRSGTFHALFFVAVAMATLALMFSLPLGEPIIHAAGEGIRRGFFSAVSQRELRPIWLIVGGFSIVLTGYFTFLKTFVEETGIGTVGSFFAAYAGTAIALRLVFAWLPARVGEKRVLFPALGMLVIGFILLARAGSGADIVLAGVLCGAGHGYAFPILLGFTVTRAPERDRGSAMAFFTALFDIGTLIGGPVLGGIIVAFGYPTMYTASALILSGVTIAYAAWDRTFDHGLVEVRSVAV